MEKEMNRWMRLQFIHLLGESPRPLPRSCFLSQRRIQATAFLTRVEYRVYAALLLGAGPSNGWKSTGCIPRDTPPRTV
jgi:hypothetical protein